MRCSKGLMTGVVLTLTATALAVQSNGKIVEKQTKRSFDAVVDGAEVGRTLTCTGVGCRKMTAFGVKIYAAAHWIDATGAVQALGSWTGRSPAQLAGDQSFYDAVASADFEKRIRLVFVHEATGKQISEGFEDSLKISYRTLPPEAKEFLDMLNAKLKVGDAVEIRWLAGGTIEVYEKDKRIGVIEKNAKFAAAVWKMWFGEKLADGHLKTLKKELIGNISAVWAAPPR